MEPTSLLLSRLQFAFTVSFHIIFPSFTIGLAAWLAVLEARYLITRRLVYRKLFEFWLRIFGVAFGLGVVSGVVLAFEMGLNWSRLSDATGPIQGPLLVYESFTAFALEAAFLGVLIYGRHRVSPGFYFLSTVMVCLGTTFSAFWIMVNNSWMQAPVGYQLVAGEFIPVDWAKIIFSPVVWVRFPHMLLAAYLTGSFCVASTGALYRLRRIYADEAQVMLRMGLSLAAILLPIQLIFGHLNGDYVHRWQPAKFAAIEARWHDEDPAAEVLIALPDAATERNRFELKIPHLGSLVAAMKWDSREVGLAGFPRPDRPPVLLPFICFRIMVGCGMLMLLIAWLGAVLQRRGLIERRRALLWVTFLSFPLPFLATLTGWVTAEVGRQPWTVYGLLRTSDSVTPTLTVGETVASLMFFCGVYVLIFSFGMVFIYRLINAGPGSPGSAPSGNPKRPLALMGREAAQRPEVTAQ